MTHLDQNSHPFSAAPIVPARQVWLENKNARRPNCDWITFELRVDLRTPATDATLHLFASTRYRLSVNHEIVGNGPIRFVPGREEFDSYDLRPYLAAGENRLTVEACLIDYNNFQHMAGDPGRFIAWGQVVSANERTDLSTPGKWVARPDASRAQDVPCFSFAIGPVEVRDLTESNAPWLPPRVLATSQTSDGFMPRSIPYPTGQIITPRTLFAAGIQWLEDAIGLVSIHPTSRSNHNEAVRGQRFRYATFIHSPVDQTVDMGLHWGPHFINGHSISATNDPELGNRQNARVHLKKGWNLLAGEPEQLLPTYPLLIGLPRGKGLAARSRPDLNDPGSMRYQLARQIDEPHRWTTHGPANLSDLAIDDAEWIVVDRTRPPNIPARMMGWDRIEETSRILNPTMPLSPPNHAARWTAMLDFGTEFVGHAMIDIDAPTGTIVDLGYDERTRPDGCLNWFLTSPFTETADRFICREGRQSFETFHPRGGRYLQVTIRVPQGGRPATLHSVRLRDAHCLPVFDKPFRSNNELFNWTWRVGVETLKASTEDVHCDSPWRERGSYLGDSYVQSMVGLRVSSDHRMSRRCLNLFAAAQRDDGQLHCVVPSWYRDPHGDFSLIYVIWLCDYWNLTHDLEIVRECLGAVDRVLTSPTWVTSTHSALWDAMESNRLFIDWGVLPEVRTYQENGVLNAFRYHALRCAAELHRALGSKDRGVAYEAEATVVRDAYRTRLWLDDQGRFAGGTVDGKPIKREILHGNVLALAYGLADQTEEQALIEFVLGRLEGNARHAARGKGGDDFVELYFLKYVLDAMVRINRHDIAKRVITDHMSIMRDANVWTLWECIHSGVKREGSLCHSWSAAPVEYLMRFENKLR